MPIDTVSDFYFIFHEIEALRTLLPQVHTKT